MRWFSAIIAELLVVYRWPIRVSLFLVALLLSAWLGIAGPVIEYYELLGGAHGVDGGGALQG